MMYAGAAIGHDWLGHSDMRPNFPTRPRQMGGEVVDRWEKFWYYVLQDGVPRSVWLRSLANETWGEFLKNCFTTGAVKCLYDFPPPWEIFFFFFRGKKNFKPLFGEKKKKKKEIFYFKHAADFELNAGNTYSAVHP